jgi:hypothetical protein
MLVWLFSGILLFQLIAYVFFDYKKIRYAKTILFILILLFYFIFLPILYYPKPIDDKPRCGMPIVAIMFVFWIIGGSITIIIHLTYYFLTRPFWFQNRKQQ